MTTMSNIIDGKKISKQILQELKNTIQTYKSKYPSPGLAVILVGNRPDSATYVRMKTKRCEEIGILNYLIQLEYNTTETEIINYITRFNNDLNIHGILVQLPLPPHINEEKVLSSVSLEKDVDGFHFMNLGRLASNKHPLFTPCTPEGCIELLNRYNIEISGKNAVIIGRSNIVGLPISLMLLHKNATVTICHSKTKNIKEKIKNADILIAACGRTEMIKKDWIKEGVVIIDVGINSVDDTTTKKGYRLVGDVDFKEASQKASWITPVPGGVGPMTIAMLLKHTVESWLRYFNINA